MRFLTVIVGMFLLSSLTKAQVLQPMGPALPGKVVASFASGNDYLALFDEISTPDNNDFTLARWNGVYWKYYPGLTTPPPVTTTSGTYNFHSIALYRDTIYAAAYIANAVRDADVAISHLYKWTGQYWVPETGVVDTRNNGIISMTVFDDKLIVAGLFSNTLDGTLVQNIAAFDGNKWSYLGNSGTQQGTDGVIRSLAVSGNRLYIAGDFTKFCGTQTGNIAYYTAANGGWGGIGSPFDGEVTELAAYDGKLAAIGYNSLGKREVNVFQGTWGSPIEDDSFSIFSPTTIAGSGKQLLIGGSFVKNGSGTALLTYNGTKLQLTGNKISGTFTLGQRGTEAFIWGDFMESNTGIRNFSKIESQAGNLFGDVYYDVNTNCIKDDNEIGLRRVMVRLMNKVTGISYFALTDSSGRFSVALPAGDYTVQLNPGKHLISNCIGNSSARIREGIYSSLTLGYYQLPSIVDVEVKTLGIVPSETKPGEQVTALISVKNHGGMALTSGTLQLKHALELVNFQSNPPADNYSANEATYTLTGLKPFAETIWEVTFDLPTNAGLTDDYYIHAYTGTLLSTGDADKLDNKDSVSLGLSRRVGKAAVTKNSLEGSKVDFRNTKWKYRVDFANVGNQMVQRAVLFDTLDAKLPLMRVNVTGFYPLNTKLSIQQGRVLVVDFPDANLAIFEANPSKAVGFVEYQLELLNPLSNGTVINNRAFVDYDSKWIGYSQNCGVVLTDLLSVKSINKGLDVVLSPNPVSDELKVSGSAKLMGKPWIIYNASGQQIASGTMNSDVITLNTGKFSSGIYSFTVNGVAQKFQVLR
ncbi:MAG: hypothetical protein RLZZ252_867 [Bacteroidota bacterium]